MNILLLGGTGTLGKAILSKLAQTDHSISVLSRNARSSTENIRWITGDLADENEHQKWLKNQDIVIASVHGFFHPKGTQKIDGDSLRKFMDRARGKIKHFIYISICNANLDSSVKVWRIKGETEIHLRRSGMDYTIFKPPIFAETWWKYSGKKAIETGRFFRFGDLPSENSYISVESIAELVTKSINNPIARDRTFFIGSDQTYTDQDLVKLMETFANRSIRLIQLPKILLHFGYYLTRWIRPGISEFLEMMLWLTEHGIYTDDTKVFDLLGVYPLSAESVWQAKQRTKAE
ncbi:MAG: NAD(P)H-binding protein [Candidatus Marinimicrobia bacterium]|nr:NAD(P)H-binding protein [Candidatus Neomarinimicrobiota bacterium]